MEVVHAVLFLALFFIASAFAEGQSKPDVTIALNSSHEPSVVAGYHRGYVVLRVPPHLEVYDLSGRIWRPDGGWGVAGPGSCVLPDIDIDSDGTLIAALGFCSDSSKGEMLTPGKDPLSFFDSSGRNIRSDFKPAAWRSIGAAFDG
ncbi:MAG: hypothetical protein ABJC09_00655 [Terriglobia bacterium]